MNSYDPNQPVLQPNIYNPQAYEFPTRSSADEGTTAQQSHIANIWKTLCEKIENFTEELNNGLANSVRWIQDTKENVKESRSVEWMSERRILSGLPVAVVSSIVLGFLFGGVSIPTAAAYGLSHYVVTVIAQEYLKDCESSTAKHAFLLVIPLLFAKALVTTTWSPVSLISTLPMAIGVWAGIARRTEILRNEEF